MKKGAFWRLPIPAKQTNKVGRPDIDSFEAITTREDRSEGFFVAFDYTRAPCAKWRAFSARAARPSLP